MQVGLARVDAVKRLAGVMKKRVEGCKHYAALDKVARSGGSRSYQHLLVAAVGGGPCDRSLEGSREELVEAWKRLLDVEFGIDVRSVLSTDEIDKWFERMFVPRAALAVDVEGEVETARQVVDPRLYEADWRDNEFRQWIQRQVERERGHRPDPVGFKDDPEEALDEAKGRG